MSPGHFETYYEDLPSRLPVFPLTGALLLPRCRLPLNIFEPRYLRMTADALARGRLIGMVQPLDAGTDERPPQLFATGCAGRITSFTETDDGRILIILTGVCRFDIGSEFVVTTPYRQVEPRWEPYRDDLLEIADGCVDRERLYASLRVYFESRDLDTDWDALDEATDEKLVNSLAMSCPFDPTEKQALLEAEGLPERSRLMLALLNTGALHSSSGDMPLH